MKTEIIRLQNGAFAPEDLDYCASVIRKGGLVAFPTETVYGLGANAFDDAAVRKIFQAKNRPADNPLIVHIADLADLSGVARYHHACEEERLMRLQKIYWPGPLTMIVGKDDRIPDAVSCGLATVGIRMPIHPIALALIEASGVPIAAPSANSSGRPSPTKFEHVYEDMNGKVDVIIDGGPCSVGVESTVLDLVSDVPTVLRPGAVTQEDIMRVLGECDACDWRNNEGKIEKPRSPGMKYRHYAPKATVTVYEGAIVQVRARIQNEIHAAKERGLRVGVLATEEGICYYKEADVCLSLGPVSESPAHANRLFDCLRTFDASDIDVILAEGVSGCGVGDAVMNRLFRAAGGHTVLCEGVGETR